MYHNSSKVAQAVKPGDILGLHNAVELIALEVTVHDNKVSIKTNQGEIVRSVGFKMKVLKKLGE